MSVLEIRAVEGLAEIGPGDPLGARIAAAIDLRDGDIVVVAQKVVSKAEGRLARLEEVTPGERAVALARALDKDPRLVELVLRETRRVIREERVLIVETHSGLVCANAGIDSSNAGPDADVILLPEDPDASARRLRGELRGSSGTRLGVLIADSFGRPWRIGQADVAIGCAGLSPVADMRGERDRDGRELLATEVAVADQIAAAADLAREKAAGLPAVVVRGLGRLVTEADGPGAAALQRDVEHDLFR